MFALAELRGVYAGQEKQRMGYTRREFLVDGGIPPREHPRCPHDGLVRRSMGRTKPVHQRHYESANSGPTRSFGRVPRPSGFLLDVDYEA